MQILHEKNIWDDKFHQFMTKRNHTNNPLAIIVIHKNNESFENKFVDSLGYTFSNDLCQSAKLSSASLGTGQANFVAEIRYGL